MHILKKCAAVITAAAILALCLVIPASAAAADLKTELTLIDAKDKYAIGDEVVFDVCFPNYTQTSRMYSYVGVVEYDRTRFEYVTNSSFYADSKQAELGLVASRYYLTVNSGKGMLKANQIKFLFIDEDYMQKSSSSDPEDRAKIPVNPLIAANGHMMRIVLRVRSNANGGNGIITIKAEPEQYNPKPEQYMAEKNNVLDFSIQINVDAPEESMTEEEVNSKYGEDKPGNGSSDDPSGTTSGGGNVPGGTESLPSDQKQVVGGKDFFESLLGGRGDNSGVGDGNSSGAAASGGGSASGGTSSVSTQSKNNPHPDEPDSPTLAIMAVVFGAALLIVVISVTLFLINKKKGGAATSDESGKDEPKE